MINVGVVCTKDVLCVDGHVGTELLDHRPELGLGGEVAVTPVEPDEVLPLQLCPNGLLTVEGTAVRGLEARVKATELLSHLVASVGRMIIHDQVGAKL